MRIILLFFITLSIFSDTILLKNGTFIRGKTILKDDIVTVETFDGKSKSIPKSEILKIDLRNMTDQEIKEIREQEEKLAIIRRERAKKANEALEQRIKDIENKIKKANAEENKELMKDLTNLRKQMNEVEEDNAVTLWGPFLRSSVLPGWGNIFVGNAKKKKFVRYSGFAYMGITLGLFVHTTVRYVQMLEKKSDYENQVNTVSSVNILYTITQVPNPNFIFPLIAVSRDSFLQYKTANDTFNTSLIALGAVYIFQLAHAYYLGYSSHTEYLVDKDSKLFDWNVTYRFEKNPHQFVNEIGHNLELNLQYRFGQ